MSCLLSPLPSARRHCGLLMAAQISPSYPGQDWFNIITAEVLNVLVEAGIAPNKGDLTQLSKAINKIISSGSLLIKNNLSEIKAAGPTAIAQTLVNLGLKEAAKRDVGTGVNQIPDMASFPASLSSNGYIKLPSGIIIQFGSASGSQVVNLPIAFPNTGLVAYASSGTPSVYATTGIFTKTTLQVVSATGGAVAWIAIGY